MSAGIDRELLAERAATVVRHLDRVAAHLPADPIELRPMTATTDTVILHRWQAVQVVIDLVVSSCVRLGLGSPPNAGKHDASHTAPDPRRCPPLVTTEVHLQPAITITTAQLPEVLLRVATARPVHVWGAPGIGTSSLVEAFAAEIGMDCVTMLDTQLAPEDLIGVPQIITDGDGAARSRFAPPEMIARATPYVLFLDELNGSSALSDTLHAWGPDPTADRVAMLAHGCLSPEHAASFGAFVRTRLHAYDLDAVLQGELRWPAAPGDRDLPHFLAKSSRSPARQGAARRQARWLGGSHPAGVPGKGAARRTRRPFDGDRPAGAGRRRGRQPGPADLAPDRGHARPSAAGRRPGRLRPPWHAPRTGAAGGRSSPGRRCATAGTRSRRIRCSPPRSSASTPPELRGRRVGGGRHRRPPLRAPDPAGRSGGVDLGVRPPARLAPTEITTGVSSSAVKDGGPC